MMMDYYGNMIMSTRSEIHMKTLFICPKKSGNTHRVCQYVCSNSGAELMALDGAGTIPIWRALTSSYSLRHICRRLHKNILEFAKGIQPDALKPGVINYMCYDLVWQRGLRSDGPN